MAALPAPLEFLRGGWQAVRQVPAVWLLRGGFEFGAQLFRFVFWFSFGLLFVLHFAAHLKSGLPINAWPAQVLTALAQPHTLLGLAGLAVTGWAIVFAAESFAFAGMWSALQRATIETDVRSWADAFLGAFATFGRAVGVRLLIRLSETALFVVVIASCLAMYAHTDAIASWSGSAVVPAFAWAAFLTVLATVVALVRLTGELVAAAVYIDDVGLADGIVQAAETMCEHPVYVYRLFVVSAAIVIPPLALAWGAALVQNMFLAVDAAVVASVFRFAAEVAIVASFVALSVMMHATFFAYYAWQAGRIERPVTRQDKHPALSDLLPERYGNVADVDEILGPWDDADVERKRSRAPRQTGARYDLAAILAGDQEE